MKLLQRMRTGLALNGRALIVEFIPDEDRITPGSRVVRVHDGGHDPARRCVHSLRICGNGVRCWAPGNIAVAAYSGAVDRIDRLIVAAGEIA